jgi:hypothetical protein
MVVTTEAIFDTLIYVTRQKPLSYRKIKKRGIKMENLNNILDTISNDDLASGGSALQNSLRIRQQFLSNGNVAIKEEIVEQPVVEEITPVEVPECIKNLSLEEIWEKGKLSKDDVDKLMPRFPMPFFCCGNEREVFFVPMTP